MKNLITYFKSCLLIILFTISSCVSDDGSFPENENNEITSTIAIVSLLNNFNSGNGTINENDLCFTFQYPITLGYNTTSTIKVDDFRGLLNVLSSQSTNFNVTGLQFPIEIKFKGSEIVTTVQNEDALFDVLKECEFDTFRDDFNELFRQCFKLDYPIVLKDNNSRDVTIDNEESFDQFFASQGNNYQPDFKFPITLLVGPNLERTLVSTYFQFYEVLSSCVGCPAIRFDIQQLPNNVYQFNTNFEAKPGYVLSLKINEEEISDFTLDGNIVTITRELIPGSYNVCIKVVTPDCPNGKEVCDTLIVEPICPELLFTFSQQQGSFIYDFVAEFPGFEQINYDWVVDNEVVEAGDGGPNGDNKYSTELSFGKHEVCIRTETPQCPQGTEKCEEIEVCPELSFTFQQEANTTIYTFTADFLGIENVNYQWTIDEQVQESDGGVDGDNVFNFEFAAGATYQVCITTEIEGCTSGTLFCEDITVP